MTEHDNNAAFAFAYRWLAQFFLQAPSVTTLESYRGAEGRALLESCAAIPALAPVATMIREMVAPQNDLAEQQARLAAAFGAAFDIGGPRAAPPYASVYLSESGRLYQQPTRDMNRILLGLQMTLPPEIKEPADHIGVQLHVAAELCARESAKQPVPIRTTAFLEQHLLSWLPDFADRCARLRDPDRISLLAQAALGLVRADVEERRQGHPDATRITAIARAAMGLARIDDTSAGLRRKEV